MRRWRGLLDRGRSPHRRRAAAGRVRQQRLVQQQQPELPAATPKAGGTYNFPLGSEPISIEPLNTQESEGAQVEHQVFQGLYVLQLQPDGTTKAVPDLAEKTEVNADATVFTFTIKQGRHVRPAGQP